VEESNGKFTVNEEEVKELNDIMLILSKDKYVNYDYMM